MSDPLEAVIPEIIESSALSVIERQDSAALDVQVNTAKTYPRSVQKFQADLEAWATMDERVADECFFVKPVGAEKIIGPSIRFAELVQASYGNLITDARLILEDTDSILVEGTCRDLERNTASRSQVRRSIIGRNKKRFPQHVVENQILGGMAIARRNAIFQVVPKALWIGIWDQARAVSVGDVETFAARRIETVKALRDLGCNMEHVKAYCGGKDSKDLDADSLLRLKMKRRAIEGGEVTAAAAFPPPMPDPEVAEQSVSDATKALKNAGKKKDEPETDSEGNPIPDGVGVEFD